MSLRRSLLALVILALAVRLLTQGWDAGTPPSPHPDERQVATVTETVGGWFDDPHFFAYGSLHFQAIRAMTAVVGHEPNWSGLIAGGRCLSLAASLGALLLGLWMARRAWGWSTALVFGWLAAWIPLNQQLSHYATVEAHHAFWVVAALAAMFQMARSATIPPGTSKNRDKDLGVRDQGLRICDIVAESIPVGQRLIPARRIGRFSLGSGFAALGSWPWALVAGAAVGASLAVKISSLALLLPLVLAIACAVTRSKRGLTAFLVFPVLVGGMVAFALGQPWAFEGGRPWFAHFNPEFLRGLNEQIAMVSGASDLPYVRIYAPTSLVFYSLRELGLWALGPALTAAALWGAALGATLLARRWRRFVRGGFSDGSLLLALLLVWVIPMAIRLSTLEVKFLRYWAPLVVPLCLVAAWFLTRLRGVAGRRLRATVLILTAVWGIAYLWAFVEPHPFATATPWLQTVIGEEDVVAWEHWDEHLGGIGAEGVTLESYNLPDGDTKVAAWCATLAKADWVVLTSNRVRRTVLANPDRYPRTSRLYRLLLAGEAGFEVAATASRTPRLAGLRAPVQRADESFVNYEFPRVVVLRRVGETDPARLVQLSLQTQPHLDGLSATALDRRFVEPARDIPPRPTAGRQVLALGLWAAFFLLGAAAWWLLLLPWLRAWPDAGLGLAVATGWIFPAWLAWIGSKIFGLPVGPASATLIFGVVVLGALVVSARRWAEVRRVGASRRRGMSAVATVIVGVFVLFLVVRLFNPAIHWGEKPMDFSFFNAFVHAPQWPPGEPWMAGEPLHYYYFADVLAAFPTLVVGSDTAVAYNLMCATVPALAAAPLAALGLMVARRKRRRWFFLMPFGVLLVGNLAWPWLLDLAGAGRWFDLWWATSRVVPGYAITEYPLWTILFADLHAHFVAIPVMVVALMWAWVVVRAPDRRWIGAAVMCGVAVAVLAATNPWDLPVFAGSLLFAVAAVAPRPFEVLARLGTAASLSVVAAAPFLVELVVWLGGGGGVGGRPLVFVTTGDYAPWWAVLRHFGLFLAPLAVAAMVRPRKDLAITGVLAAAGLAVGLAFSSSAAAVALAAAALFLTMVRWAPDRWQATAWSLAGTAMVFVALAERLTLMDRMNTIFKTYNGAWLLLAVALAIVLLRARGRILTAALPAFLVLAPVALVNLPLGIAQGRLQPRMPSPCPTLDGRAFLRSDPSDAFLITALNGAARPGEVVAEAAGSSYRQFTRIAMHTGLPTVVGWEWHLRQRGQIFGEIENRVRDLETIYAGVVAGERRRVLDCYGIDWIVLGDLERATYGLDAVDPFEGIPGVVLWARQGNSVLYRVLHQ